MDDPCAIYKLRIRLLNKRILELKAQLRDAVSAQCQNCAVEEQWEKLANGFSDIDQEC